MGSAKKEVEYPDFYQLPPFFTLQPNLATRQKQCQMWTELLSSYSSATGKYELSINEAVFENAGINRRLSPEGYECLLQHMVHCHKADALPGGGMRVYVFSKRELAEMLFAFVERSGKLGSVETVFSFHAGEECEGERFAGLPKECILGALQLLEKEGKCEVFGADDVESAGVKFFA